MTDTTIEKTDWAGFLQWVSESLAGAGAEIEVMSLNLGPQVEATSLPLLGISYDHKSDVINVALEGLNHLIHAPRELIATEGSSGLDSITAVDGNGARQTVKFRRSLALPGEPAPAWRREPAKNRVVGKPC